jgi:hypothetical protein
MSGYAKYLRLIGTYKGITKYAPEMSMMRRLQTSADMLLGKEGKIPIGGEVNMPGLRRFLIFAGFAYFSIAAIGSFARWSSMTVSQQAIVIISSIQAALAPMRYLVNSLGALEGWADRIVPQWMRDLSAASYEFRAGSSIMRLNQNLYRYEVFRELGHDGQIWMNHQEYVDHMHMQIDPNYDGARFNWRANWFRIASALLNLALSIWMGIELFTHWSDRPLVDNILNTIVWVSIVLATIADGIILLSLANVAIWSSVLAICAWAGPLMIVVAIIVALVSWIISLIRGPPLSPMETWIKDHGHSFVNSLDNPPANRLEWSWSKVSAYRFDIVGKNTGATTTNLTTIETSFTSGGSDGTLFKGNGPFKQGTNAGDTDSVVLTNTGLASDSKIRLAVTPGSAQQGISATQSTVLQWLVKVDIYGKDLAVPAGASVTLSLAGTFNGSDKYSLIVTETFATTSTKTITENGKSSQIVEISSDSTTAELVLNKS